MNNRQTATTTNTTTRTVAIVLLCSACLILQSGIVCRASEEEAAAAAAATTAGHGDQPQSDRLFEADDSILTPTGEAPIDYKSGQVLPEEVNDGELEHGDHHVGWTYTNQNSWSGEYAQCKGSSVENFRQSPIDIVTDRVKFNPRLHMEFVDYDQEVEFEFKNTHHSVSLTPIPSISTPTVRVNWIPGDDSEDFELQEIHFHWGDGINKGSEHEINDQKAAAEMHMVHYRKGLNKAQIGTTENSVLVVGVLIESDKIEHNKLESLVKKTELINGTDLEYIDNNPENLINLLPDSHHSFYTYNGSLTTPPCYEVVTWVVMSEPVYISQEKLVELSNMETLDAVLGKRKIHANNRDIQPLLNRPVYASFNTTDSVSPKLKPRTRFFDGHNFRAALKEYWAKVNQLKTTVNKAFRAIESARYHLQQRLGITRNKDMTKVTEQSSSE